MQQAIAPTYLQAPIEIELRCVWPDYQLIKAPVELDPLVIMAIDRLKLHLSDYSITRIMLINDVIYPFNNIARDVLKFDPAEISKLDEDRKQSLFSRVQATADELAIDPSIPTQAVLWNNDIYMLMSTRAAVLKSGKRA